MESCFRIFKLVNTDGEVLLKDASLIDTKIFKYHANKGDFKTREEARDWLSGLSLLQGQYAIIEVFTKSS